MCLQGMFNSYQQDMEIFMSILSFAIFFYFDQ